MSVSLASALRVLALVLALDLASRVIGIHGFGLESPGLNGLVGSGLDHTTCMRNLFSGVFGFNASFSSVFFQLSFQLCLFFDFVCFILINHV